MLLVGPPGLGKTSLAYIVREELGVGIRCVAGPALERKGDLAAILTALEPRDVLFIDEIHRLIARRRGGALPGARGLPARHHRRPGARGADAHARRAAVHARRRDDAHGPADDAAARPLRDDVPARVLRAGGARRSSCAARRGSSASRSTTTRPTRSPARSRGTPRVANRILRRVRDVAEVRHEGAITTAIAAEALELLEVDEPRPRAHRPRAPAGDRRALRRRPGRPVDAGRRPRRGAGHGRGRLRAVPAPARLHPAHAARPDRDEAGPGPRRRRAKAEEALF